MSECWREIAEKMTQEMNTDKLILLSQELNHALAERDMQQKFADKGTAA